jgi:hypothetical protein
MINIPQTLQDRQQWVLWRLVERDGKPTKMPFSPEGKPASVADPNTWTDFQTALEAYHRGGFDGIGFVLTADAGIVCVDLDHARNCTDWTPEAMEMVRLMNSYTEVSPSGQGLHIWCYGHLPAGRRRKNGVEMYDSGRFITVTGDHLPITPTDLQERTAELMELHRQVFGDISVPAKCRELSVCNTDSLMELDDQELLEKAMNAENGAKFRALWRGDTTGYHSQSEADLALCRLLAFWTGGDAERIERLFSQSALGQREKWQTRADYRQRTIAEAIGSLRETYNGNGNGNGHRQNPRQLRQNRATDAEPSGTDNLTTTQESHATTQPGANTAPPRKPTRPAPQPWQTQRPKQTADTGGTESADTGERESADTVGTDGGVLGSSLAGEAARPVLAALEDHSGELSPLCGDSTPSSTLVNIVRPNETVTKSYSPCNKKLQPVKQKATTCVTKSYNICNEELHHLTVAEMILAHVSDRGSITLADLLALTGCSEPAARQALRRLVRAGKLVRRGSLYFLPSADETEGETLAEYARRNGISEVAARVRLKRLVDSGRALRLARGLYFVLPDNWQLVTAEWNPCAVRRDQRGREYYELELCEPIGSVQTIRFYMNETRYNALCAASEILGLERRSCRIAVARKFRGGRSVYDCVAIVDKSGSRLLWREREKD